MIPHPLRNMTAKVIIMPKKAGWKAIALTDPLQVEHDQPLAMGV
jgi:hypothetical protein